MQRYVQFAESLENDGMVEGTAIALDVSHSMELRDYRPPVYDKIHVVEMKLNIDVNNVLRAEAYDPIGGKTEEIQYTYQAEGNDK